MFISVGRKPRRGSGGAIKPLLSLLVSRTSLSFTCRNSQHSRQVVGPPAPRHLTSNGSIARVITVLEFKTILPSLLGQDSRESDDSRVP